MNQNNDSSIKEKADFGLSGNLRKDSRNTLNGVILKWAEPADAVSPMGPSFWHLYTFQGDQISDTYFLDKQSAYLIGRENKVADILIQDKSVSLQHAVIQFRLKKSGNKAYIRPYILDLETTNGTLLNGNFIESSKYIELLDKDVIRFGHCDTDFVILKVRPTKNE